MPVLDTGAGVLRLALMQRSCALAALLHAADALVQEKKLAARVAVPECPIAGLPDRAGSGLAVDDDLGHRLVWVDPWRQLRGRRLAGTRRGGRRRRLAT